MRAAHWIQRTHLFQSDEFVCSRCGTSYNKAYKVCPSCQSTMDRAEYDASWVDEAEGLSAILDDDW